MVDACLIKIPVLMIPFNALLVYSTSRLVHQQHGQLAAPVSLYL